MINTFKQFNWIDIFIVILLLRIGYIAIKNGLPAELFKLLGSISSVYLSLHYYPAFSSAILGRFLGNIAGFAAFEFISFIFLSLLGYMAFVFLRLLFYRFIKMEAVPQLNKWGGFVLGLVRGFLIAGLIVFMLVISDVNYFKESILDSFSGRRIFKIAPAVYASLWNGFFSKVMPKEKFNEEIPKIEKEMIP